MSESIERQDHERAIARARQEGAAAERRRTMHWVVGVVGVALLLLVGTVGLGWSLANRAKVAAPGVIEEIAAERRAALESRFSARSQEAQALAVDIFEFLQRVWQDNEALLRARTNARAATAQVGLLTDEMNAALESPRANLGTLLENGPTRARAVVGHVVIVAGELRRIVPLVVGALEQAKIAFDDEATASLSALLNSLDALLDPFIGTNAGLEAQWQTLQSDLTAWMQRVEGDLDYARKEMSGDELGDEFMRRLRHRVF
jgi:hypothetical protein